MKNPHLLPFVLLLGGCLMIKGPELLIDLKNEYVWVGESDSGTYMLRIDSNEGIWFEGILTRNTTDTFYVRGFEKGNHHYSFLRTVHADTLGASHLGNVSFWTRGWHADTLDMVNTRDSVPVLPMRMQLYKRAKNG